MTGPRFDGWIPIRIYWRDGEPIVEWCYLGDAPLDDPFLLETVQKALATPFGSLFRRHSRMSDLRSWRERSPGVRPSGFIFHSSRCGSTLITRMLARSSHNLVLSEPEPISAIVFSHATEEQRGEWLRDILSALAQPRAREHHLFVKLEPRDIFMLPLFRKAFPEVPWLFVYRDPIEVLVSNLLSPAAYLTRGIPSTTGIDLATPGDTDEHMAATLGAILAHAATAFPDPRGMLVNYRQLPEALWGSIARHFGLCFTPEEIVAFQETAQFDAKRPTQKFAPDGTHKNQVATPRTRALAERWMQPHFARLEVTRVS